MAELDSIDPSQADESIISSLEELRQELLEGRSRETIKSIKSEELARSSRTATEYLEEARRLGKKMPATLHLLTMFHTYMVITGSALGIVAEIIALWGAIGLFNGLAAIALVTFAAILIMGMLGLFAIDRLTSSWSSWLPDIIMVIWSIMTFGAATLTAIGILSTVKAVSLPRPAPP